jgi:acyl carrier protein
MDPEEQTMTRPRVVDQAEVVERARTWVRDNFLYMRPDWPLGEDTPLLKSGVIDSIGVVELVSFLEQTFQVVIPEDQITERNLGTLGAIGAFVEGKTREDQGPISATGNLTPSARK